MAKIMLDAGHDINTPGKGVAGMKEFEFNKATTLKVAAILNGYEGVDVVLSHDLNDGIDTSLKARTDFANSLKVDAFVSIHANAASATSARGIETFIYPSAGDDTYNFARGIHDHTINNTGMRNRGVKRADFHVLRETHMRAALIECGFMTNAEDLALLKSDDYRQKCAQGIAHGIIQFFNLKAKAAPAPAPASQPSNTGLYKVQLGAFSNFENAERLRDKAIAAGFNAAIIKD